VIGKDDENIDLAKEIVSNWKDENEKWSKMKIGEYQGSIII
jgi:hypothetical protein